MMKHFRIRKPKDRVSEDAHVWRGCTGAIIVLIAIAAAFWKWGPADMSSAQPSKVAKAQTRGPR